MHSTGTPTSIYIYIYIQKKNAVTLLNENMVITVALIKFGILLLSWSKWWGMGIYCLPLEDHDRCPRTLLYFMRQREVNRTACSPTLIVVVPFGICSRT